MFKKILALFIVAIMVLTVSCSGESAELLAFIDENADSVIDCEGKTFSFASTWYSEWYAFEDDELPTVAVEKMMKRFHSIKDEFNANFEMMKMTTDEISRLLISGGMVPEMLDTMAYVAYDLYKSKVLAPLNNLSAVDLNNIKWGAKDFIQFGNFGGEQYGFQPWHWEVIPQFAGATIFNAELIEKFGGEHPYELHENGNWNWESFENELAKYTVIDGEIQYYGVITDYDGIVKAAIFSNGGQIIEGNQEDGYEYGVKSNASVQALEWLATLETAGYLRDGDITEFSKKQISPYFVGESYFGTNFNPNSDINDEYISNNLNDYGFITFPTGPQGNESDVGAYMVRTKRLNFVSQISDIESENIGAIINYIFEPLDDSPEEGWKTYVQSMIFSENNNQKCSDFFYYIVENIGYDYSVQMGESAFDALNNAFKKIVKGSSASEVLSSIESQIMAEFDK